MIDLPGRSKRICASCGGEFGKRLTEPCPNDDCEDGFIHGNEWFTCWDCRGEGELYVGRGCYDCDSTASEYDAYEDHELSRGGL